VLLSLLYSGSGLPWMSELPALLSAVLTIVLLGRLAAVWQTRSSPVAGAIVAVAVVLSLSGLGEYAGRPLLSGAVAEIDDDGEVVDGVAAFVRAQSEYGRVFVLGYDALGLLSGRTDDLFVPVLDIHLPVLRVDYWGQDLYLLVKRPDRRGQMDAVYHQRDDLYSFGTDRALYAGDWDEWRLFEVVTAPRRDPSEPPAGASGE